MGSKDFQLEYAHAFPALRPPYLFSPAIERRPHSFSHAFSRCPLAVYFLTVWPHPLSIFLWLLGIVFPLTVCAAESKTLGTQRTVRLPATPFSYELKLDELGAQAAEIVARFDNTPDENPITDDGATLGRVLFYDPRLSADGSTSCASCHRQERAFTDPRPKSIGFAGGMVQRNSMSLINVRFYRSGKMFWDERAESLEQQVLQPIEDPVEMGHTLERLLPQLNNDPIYAPLFENAFGDPTVTAERVARALSQFVRSIVSFRSRYDEGLAQTNSVLDPFPNFSDEENYGKQQFFGRGRCADCHLDDPTHAFDRIDDQLTKFRSKKQPIFFQSQQASVNGIDSEDGDDRGKAQYTGRANDVGKFKVPSLRNVEVTGPYMHDGRFHTLDQVIEHYNWSVRPHPNLDARLEFATAGIALPEREKVALTKFLLTLTDHHLLKDERFSDPFHAAHASVSLDRQTHKDELTP